MKRRKAIKDITTGLVIGTATLSGITSCNTKQSLDNHKNTMKLLKLKGNINHAVCKWCYSKIPFEQFCESAKEIGIKGIDLVSPEDWQILDKYGLKCSVANDVCANLTEGFNNISNHKKLIKPYIELIDKAAEHGIKNVIVFSGNKYGLNSEEGLENCAIGLDGIVKHAEQKNVMIIMELLNSKIDHEDYQCDNTPWGVKMVDKLGSPNFKLLYDIYHMQIMEGDIIRTIRDYSDYFAHYHTGGVPGRNEINDNQELNYPAIMKAIVETGYKGYVAQEFIPTYQDQISALKEGIMICDV